MRPPLALLLVSAALLAPAAARAQLAPSPPTEDRAGAALSEQLFYKGRDLMAQHRFAEACTVFEQAELADATIGVLLNLADCYERSGRTASAFAKFGEAALAAQHASDSREPYARQRLAALETHLTKITVDALSLTGVPGAEVLLDHRRLDPTQWGTAIAVDPGRHTVDAQAPARVPWSLTFDAAASMTVAVPALRILADSVHPVGDTSAPSSSFWTPRKATSLSLMIAGAISVGVGAYFGIQSHNDLDQATSLRSGALVGDGTACKTQPVTNMDACQHLADTVSSQRRDATLSDVFYVAGGAFVAGAAAVWLLWPKGDVNQKGVRWLEPRLGQGEAGFSLRGAF